MTTYEEADLGELPITTADEWLAASRAKAAERRPLSRADRAALARLPGVLLRLGFPIHGGDLPPGSLLWWPETESGCVSIFGSTAEDACLLIDRQTGYWRLTVTIWPNYRRESYRCVGWTVTALVAQRFECEPDDATERLMRFTLGSGI